MPVRVSPPNSPAAATPSPPSPAIRKKSPAQANVTPTKGDVMDQAGLARLLAGHDAAISSVHFLASDPAKLIGAAKDSKVGRYLVVGGAGSLEVAPGVRLVTTPGFPVAYKAEAEKGAAFLDLLRRRKGTQLDLPVALGPVCGRRANRQVPPRNRPAFDRRRRQKLDFLRGFRSCTRRRDRAPGPYPPALHGRLLERAGRPDNFACARPWGRTPKGMAYIVCHNPPLYKARADGQFSAPPCT